MSYYIKPLSILTLLLGLSISFSVIAQPGPALVPAIEGNWWTIAGNPDLGELTSEGQQPVDFGIWQAADSSWQVWSCIRATKAPGKTRLLHRWQAANLTDRDWTPMGIAMQADPKLGEEPGGLQAPYVTRIDNIYHMFYGDWNRICLATSLDGIEFERKLENGSPALFGDPEETNTRDAMVLLEDETYYLYYTAHPNQIGAVYLRTSPDLRIWSESTKVAYGGQAGGDKFWQAECPFVVKHPSGYYYLFRTQSYGRVVNGVTEQPQKTSVYRSKNLSDFGINDDQYFVGTMEVAAPEIFRHEGQWYMAALLPDLQGIRIAQLRWDPQP
ncbi:MAG: hypothetical protein RIG62_04520 [Cyclobacteriaceae bacterium]